MENINPDSLAVVLNTNVIGRNIIYFPSVTSTNDVAKEQARQKAPEGSVVIAGEQTSGKGRLGRVWKSPVGTLAYSVILYPSVSQLSYLIMIASVSVVRAISKIAGINVKIKWPNDILANGKKICGILIENSVRGNIVDYSVIGIGINTGIDLTKYPDLKAAATSLSIESRNDINLVSLIRQLLIEMDDLYVNLFNAKAIFEEWRGNLVTLGQNVRAISGNSTVEGFAESVDSDGSLLVRKADGKLVLVAQGDVTLRNEA